MKAIHVLQTNAEGQPHFALSHEDALAAFTAIDAVRCVLRDETRWELEGVLHHVLIVLKEYLHPEEAKVT